MSLNRRALVAAAAAASFVGNAHGASSDYRSWTRVANVQPLPMRVGVNTGERVITLGEWLGDAPAVLALWATWCAPCLIEKPAQVAMARRLAASGSRTRILALQAYDNVDLTRGRAMLARLGAADLVNAAAMPDAEDAFIRLLGPAPSDNRRTSMPWHLLIDSRGRELARSVGLMTGRDGGYTYFEDDAAFEFLRDIP